MPPPRYSWWHSWEVGVSMYDRRGIVLSEALFLLMILGILALICLQCALMTHAMEQNAGEFENDAVEEVYQE